jgi:hypothetical protein
VNLSSEDEVNENYRPGAALMRDQTRWRAHKNRNRKRRKICPKIKTLTQGW